MICCTSILKVRNARGERLPLEFSLFFALSRTRARQAVFVFILHLFTRVPQMVVTQRVRGEGFCFYVHGGDGWGSPWRQMEFTVDETGCLW